MVLSPEATEDEVTATVERVKGLISKSAGDVEEHEVLGVRPLAYPIKKFHEGTYVLTRFTLDSSQVMEFNRTLDASEDILRFLLTKV